MNKKKLILIAVSSIFTIIAIGITIFVLNNNTENFISIEESKKIMQSRDEVNYQMKRDLEKIERDLEKQYREAPITTKKQLEEYLNEHKSIKNNLNNTDESSYSQDIFTPLHIPDENKTKEQKEFKSKFKKIDEDYKKKLKDIADKLNRQK